MADNAGFISWQEMLNTSSKLSEAVVAGIKDMEKDGDKVTTEKMFKMQIVMSKLTQFSEMMSNVISAANSSIASMARNVKS